MKKTTQILLQCLLVIPFTWAQTDTTRTKNKLQEIVVKGIQTNQKKPVPFTTLDRKQISRLYYGADIPSLLAVTPSVNYYSDNGTGMGYSYFRLRGMDQTRINTTINGIPVNDPENQGVFFNNFADLASSAQQIQVQRGIGTSTNGTSAFGGSVNVSTKTLSLRPEASLSTGFGSFGSSRLTAEMQTGLLNNHWMFYGRLSKVKTDGFRERSGVEVQSYQFSLGYAGKQSMLKFNFFGGNSQSQLAYAGIDQNTYQTNPKANPFTYSERDAFQQFFNQIQYSCQLGRNSNLSASAYLVKGKAPQFQFLFPASWGYGFDFFNLAPNSFYVSGSDTIASPGDVMSSYCLNQTLAGGFVNYHAIIGKVDLDAGIHVNNFVSNHFMQVNWANYLPAGTQSNHLVYSNTGIKNEQSAYVKANHQISRRFSFFGDIQLRHATFAYSFRQMLYRVPDGQVNNMDWLFINPRLGGRFEVNATHAFTGFIGFSRREPTRFDYFQDDFAPSGRNIQQNEIQEEQVLDLEFGYQITSRYITGRVNVFAMEFQNQIVGTGALNNFGYPVTGNIGQSYRRGVELDFTGRLNNHFSYWLNLAASSNRAKQFQQTYTNIDLGVPQTISYANTKLAFSPEQIHSLGIKSHWFSNTLFADADIKYVGSQFIDNTENAGLSIPSFTVVDFQMGLNLKTFFKHIDPVLSFRINNLLDAPYTPAANLGGSNTINNAGTRGQSPLLFTAAGINYFISLQLNF